MLNCGKYGVLGLRNEGGFWVYAKGSRAFFVAWNSCFVEVLKKKIWRMSFFIIVWFIWLFRNEMVFEGNVWDLIKVLDTTKIKVAW